MNQAVFIIYLFLVFSLAVVFVRKARPKYPIVSFILSLFIMMGDLGEMNQFKLSLGFFDLQPIRFLFLFSIAFLIVDPFIQQYRNNTETVSYRVRTNFEIYLILFTCLAVITYVINYQYMAKPVELYTYSATAARFLVIYYVVKRASDHGFIETIKYSIITVCLFSATFAVIQFVGDQSFFRVTSFDRPAFAGLIRSTGVFRDDYLHSYVLFCGLIWVFYTVENAKKKTILISLILVGILLAFMRMGYIVTALFLGLATLNSAINKKLKVLIISFALIAGVFGMFGILFSGVLNTSAAEERMLDQSTMDLRFIIFESGIKAAFESTKSILIGHGTVLNPVYYDLMYQIMPGWADGESGGWHNFYIYVLFFNGLPALTLLIFFLGNLYKYFNKLSKNHTNYYLIAKHLSLGYIIANLTLALNFDTPFAIILAVSAGIAMRHRQQQIQKEKNRELSLA